MINVSFVGCGGMAAHYLGVYRDLDWVRVVNCIDADPAAAQKAAETIPGAAAGRASMQLTTRTQSSSR